MSLQDIKMIKISPVHIQFYDTEPLKEEEWKRTFRSSYLMWYLFQGNFNQLVNYTYQHLTSSGQIEYYPSIVLRKEEDCAVYTQENDNTGTRYPYELQKNALTVH